MGASAVALCLSFGAAARADQPAALSEDGANLLAQARELWVEGTSALNRGQLERARLLYLSAWRAQRHWQIAGSLGHVELALGRHRDAAEHLTIYLRESRDFPNVDPRDRALLSQELERARTKIGVVTVAAEPAGAEVLVDGSSVGKTPLSDPVFVEPGRHVIEARLSGYQAAAEARETAPGAVAEVRLRLSPKVAAPKVVAQQRTPLAPTAQRARPPVILERDWRTSYVPAGTAFGVGALGLGVGAVTGAVSLAKVADIRTRCTETRCDPSDNGARTTAHTLGDVSTAAFVVGGIGVAAGGVLLGLRRYSLTKPATGGAAAWSFDVGPGHVLLKGSF